MRLLAFSPLALFCVLAAGCGHRVGDHCATNVDCSPLGDRFCDVSAPSSEPSGNGDQGGYCTIDGCDVRLNSANPPVLTDSCPSEAVCVRFFTPEPSRPCTGPEDLINCLSSERCVCDCTNADGSCKACDSSAAGTVAHCAPETSEHRWCMLTCSKDTDCRGSNYECRAAGTLGAQLVPGEPNPSRFCVQKATAQ